MSGYLSAVISPTGDISYPWYCGAGGFTDWLDECKPATWQQVRDAQRAGMGPGMTPENVEQALATGDEVVAAYCRMHPEECRGNDDPNWLLWVALLLGGLFLIRLVTR